MRSFAKKNVASRMNHFLVIQLYPCAIHVAASEKNYNYTSAIPLDRIQGNHTRTCSDQGPHLPSMEHWFGPQLGTECV